LEPSDEPIGESWEVSAVPSSTSVISNGVFQGRDLVSVINEYPEEILGKAVNEKYQGKLPLLVKFIDAEKDLSIQVHPNDEMAQREHGKMGKSEMWYVIKADKGSHLYAGFKQEITPEEYQRRIADGTIVDVLADHSVKAGDVFYLPAGRVHAICGGIMLAEVQQSSDVTYRIYDYNRPGMDGKPRQLHTELAARALNYHVEKNYRTEYFEDINKAIQIVDTPYFDTRVMEISKSFHRDLRKYDSFIISMCIEGDCEIRVRSTGDVMKLRQGSSALIPAKIADYDVTPLRGTSLILDAFIDNMDRTVAAQLSRFMHMVKQ
jgi:mannose-6-phosphate isomerase